MFASAAEPAQAATCLDEAVKAISEFEQAPKLGEAMKKLDAAVEALSDADDDSEATLLRDEVADVRTRLRTLREEAEDIRTRVSALARRVDS